MPGSVRVILELLAAGAVLALLAWRVWAAVRAGRDALDHGWAGLASLGWAASAAIFPAWYWQQGRLERLGPDEAHEILLSAARAHRLASVANLRCPLCDAEMVNVLNVTADGRLVVASQSRCPRCDFRLDACRHCRHFLPARDAIGGQIDMTHGRCQAYRAPQPVAAAYPDMARQLTALGYDTLNAPKPIIDSFLPLDECRSFALDDKRLRLSKVKWLGRERLALLQLRQRTQQRAGG
jgi:hypothetical protein